MIMTPEEVEDVFERAANHALLYGCGFIRIVHNLRGTLTVDIVEPEEYLDMSKALLWASENMEKRVQQ